VKLQKITVCVALAFTQLAYAEPSEILPEVSVSASRLKDLPEAEGPKQDKLKRAHIHTSDTARMLEGMAGVSMGTGGGMSSLPAVHGMADDRVRVKVDGMDLISACANHMNPPLSYIAPANVASVKVMAGITPVSQGGDSIAGTIQVDSSTPQFASDAEHLLLQGQASAYYRSNNQAQGGSVSATVANETLSVRYTGATTKAKNYKAGAAFKAPGVSVGTIANVYVAGDEVASSQYQSDNHALAFGLHRDNHLYELTLGQQRIPYQGFPNQYMDMLKNDSQQTNLKYSGDYAWGTLQARAYHEHTQHYMNFLEAKTNTMSPLGMPMNTDGQNSGYAIKGDVVLSERDVLRVGAETQRYRLNDWWSPIGPVVGTMAMANMMTGGDFQNINNGQRDKLDVFGEWEARWSKQWLSQLGLRASQVKMDAGVVQGYNTIAYPVASYATFNTASRQHTDNNIDVTALTRFTPDETGTYELGFAQKTRSPNLYERYTWSTNNAMAMHMNNWFGDGNGYVGDINLKPEVARTLSGAATWQDASGYALKVAPYYTHVQNYIDAARCTVAAGTACTAANLIATTGFVNLQFVNQNARLYGADVTASMPVATDLSASGVVNYVQGKNLTTGEHLYHIMPLNATLSLEQHRGAWRNTLEAKFVSAKTQVQAVRNELRTSGYGVLALRSSYEWQQLRLDLGVENLLNHYYADPLGGNYMGQRPMGYGISVPGMGRSINVGVTVKF